MPNEAYRLYPKAIEDLESIYIYGTREFGVQRSDNYILTLETSFQRLAENPLIARQCDYIRQNLRVFNVGTHIIFFKITSYGIAVIRHL